MSKTARTIYGLGLNEVEQIGDAFWRRVPGGWIVTETYLEERAEVQHRLHPVFVPFSLPERDTQWSKQALTQLGKMATPSQVPPGPQEQREAASEPHTITVPSRMNEDPPPAASGTTDDDDNEPGF